MTETEISERERERGEMIEVLPSERDRYDREKEI